MKLPPRLACVAISLVSLGCVAGQPVAPTPSAAASTSPAKLAGRVTLPILALGTGGIIPTGIGAVIAAGGEARQRQLLQAAAALDERPVAGALVVALDATTLVQLPGTAAVKTDATGGYSLDVPAGDRNVVLEAVFRSPDGSHAFRLLGAAKPGAAANISWSSTAAVASLLDASGHARAELASADLASLEAAANASVEARPREEVAAILGRTLDVDVKAVPALVTTVVGLIGSPPPNLGLPLPSPVPSGQAPSAAPSSPAGQGGQPVTNVVQPVTSALPSVLGALTQPVTTPVQTATQPVQAVTELTQTVTQAVVPTPLASTAASVPQAVTSAVQSVVQSPLPLPLPSVRLF